MPDSPSPRDVWVLVCLECGREIFFEDGAPGDDVRCDKCGNAVFRDYRVSPRGSEAGDAFRAETERDMTPEEGPGEVTPGDVRDVGRL